MHPAFQFNSATGRLQADGREHPLQGAPVEAQHNLLRGVPRYAEEQGTITSFCHLLSLVHLLLLCSFEFPLADLHLVFPITGKRLATTPPPSALPPASILAALPSIGGVSVP